MFGQSRSTLSWSIGSCPYRDRDSILTARTLAREEGLLVGGSAGLAVAAGLRIATELTRDHIVVILLPDSGRSYLSKYHNDTWLRRLGFLDDDRDRLRVIDALQRRAAVEEVWLGSTSESGSVSIPSTASIERALDVAAASVSGSAPIPVVLPREPGGLPAAVSEVLGVVSRDTLQTNARANGPELTAVQLAQPVSVFLGTGESCADAVARLIPLAWIELWSCGTAGWRGRSVATIAHRDRATTGHLEQRLAVGIDALSDP
jgi:cystathionine beta-synthase